MTSLVSISKDICLLPKLGSLQELLLKKKKLTTRIFKQIDWDK
jgi:hypothetical protein